MTWKEIKKLLKEDSSLKASSVLSGIFVGSQHLQDRDYVTKKGNTVKFICLITPETESESEIVEAEWSRTNKRQDDWELVV